MNGMTSDAAFAMAYVYEMLNENGVREPNGTLKEVLKDACSCVVVIATMRICIEIRGSLVNLTPLVQETAPGRYPEYSDTKAIVKEFLD